MGCDRAIHVNDPALASAFFDLYEASDMAARQAFLAQHVIEACPIDVDRPVHRQATRIAEGRRGKRTNAIIGLLGCFEDGLGSHGRR